MDLNLLVIRRPRGPRGDPALQGPRPVHYASSIHGDDQADHELLETLCGLTGGAVLGPDEMDSLNELLPRRSVTTENPLVEPVWNAPLALILIIVLVTVEWIGRKIMRLV